MKQDQVPLTSFPRLGSGQAGMTLIEIVVAIAVFFIIVAAAVGIFSSSVKIQKRALATQELLDQTSYVMEYMSRALRMATKELNCTNPLDPATCDPSNPPYCLMNKGYGWNYETNPPDYNKIKFINHLQDNDCQEFFLDTTNHRIKYKTSEGEFYLTSSNLQVESLQFALFGESQGDIPPRQPQVTMFLKIKGRGLTSRPELRIQTTISQRNLDITY